MHKNQTNPFPDPTKVTRYSELFGTLLLAAFISSLPWVWVNILPIATNVRPAALFVIPLFAYHVFRHGFPYKNLNWGTLSVLFLSILVWMIPAVIYEVPHWNVFAVSSIAVYGLVGYFGAISYLSLSQQPQWKMYWPFVCLSMLLSTMLSFHFAFGSLLPNTAVASSRDFIFGTLYSGVFNEEGKGIRHTMALCPVLLMALVFHNKNISPKLNIIVFTVCVYLAFFTFSRSAWLAAFLIMLLVMKGMAGNIQKSAGKFLITGVILLIAFFLLMMLNPKIIEWVYSIFSDRLADDESTSGRLWVLGYVLFESDAMQYLFGFDQTHQQKPHNFVLDSMMQSGLIGLVLGVVIFTYVFKRFLKPFFSTRKEYFVIAAFVAPGLVRLFTAGNGLLHIVEMFGICVAANLLLFNRTPKIKQVDDSKNKPHHSSKFNIV